MFSCGCCLDGTDFFCYRLSWFMVFLFPPSSGKMSPPFWPPVAFVFYSTVSPQSLILMLTYLSTLKISTDEVTLMHRKLPMIQVYIPHNLPILCNILDGRKQILSVSQWYVHLLIFGTRLIIKILGWCHCCGIHFALSPPCWRRCGTYCVSGTCGGALIFRYFAFYYDTHVTTWTV